MRQPAVGGVEPPIYTLLSQIHVSDFVPPPGFEPGTSRLRGESSKTRLSYRGIVLQHYSVILVRGSATDELPRRALAASPLLDGEAP